MIMDDDFRSLDMDDVESSISQDTVSKAAEYLVAKPQIIDIFEKCTIPKKNPADIGSILWKIPYKLLSLPELAESYKYTCNAFGEDSTESHLVMDELRKREAKVIEKPQHYVVN